MNNTQNEDRYPELPPLEERLDWKPTTRIKAWFRNAILRPVNVYFIELYLFFCTSWWGLSILINTDYYTHSSALILFVTSPLSIEYQAMSIIAAGVLTLIASASGVFWFRATTLMYDIFIWGVISSTILRVTFVPTGGLLVFMFVVSMYAFIRLTFLEVDKRNSLKRHQDILARYQREEE